MESFAAVIMVKGFVCANVSVSVWSVEVGSPMTLPVFNILMTSYSSCNGLPQRHHINTVEL